jgi:CHAT domain-containing protein
MALGRTRPVEGRLIGLRWVPLASNGPRSETVGRLRATAIEVDRALAKERTVEALRDRALIALIGGRTNLAVADLSAASARRPASAGLLSDLAAVHLQRARIEDDRWELVLGLAAASKAVALDQGLLAAQFNRALALERLYLQAEARDCWQRYAAAERDPGWAREAAVHLAAVAAPAAAGGPSSLRSQLEAATAGDHQAARRLAQRVPQALREYAEGEVLARWATAEAADRRAEADRWLAMARAAGEALARGGGDPMVADTVGAIDRARRQGSAHGHLRGLVRGHSRYGAGLELMQKGDFAGALPALLEARRHLVREASPFARWAAYQIAVCHYQHARYREVREWAEAAGDGPECQRYPAHCARTQRLLGLVRIIDGNPIASLAAFAAGRTMFVRLRETGNAAALRSLVAMDQVFLGQSSAAWRSFHEALRDSAGAGSPLARAAVCDQAAWLVEDLGEPLVALYLQDEVLRAAVEAKLAFAVAEAYRRRAAILGTLGRAAEAAGDLRRARDEFSRLPDLGARRIVEGDILAAAGELARQRSVQEAIVLLGRAARLYRQTGYHFQLSQALLESARGELALGDERAAEGHLGEAAREVEAQREKIPSTLGRAAYLAHEKAPFDQMISLLAARCARAEDALAYGERERAQTLLDWIRGLPLADATARLAGTLPPPIPIHALRRRLPASLTVVEFSVLPDRLITWVVRADHLWLERVAIDAGTLAQRVTRLRQALRQHRSEETRDAASELYDLLIGPVARRLPEGGRLVLVPDGPLHEVPFALLRDRSTGKYLIQAHALSVVPSMSVLDFCLRRERELGAAPRGRALVIGDPSFDPSVFPSLQRLPGAAAEARLLVEAYPGSRALLVEQASKAAFLDMADQFQIVHFAGHAVANPEYPLLSQLLFAARPGEPGGGVLFSWEILGRRFRNARLVVLAGCDTAQGAVAKGESIEGLAGPFLAAGVPAVIASLGPADDQVASDLFGRFYRNLAAGLDGAGSLRGAQVELALRESASSQPDFGWASFELIGPGTLRTGASQGESLGQVHTPDVKRHDSGAER